MRRTLSKYDIVMYQQEEWTTKNWVGYISNPDMDSYGYISVRWWDEELKVWTLEQNVPARNLDYIGTVVG